MTYAKKAEQNLWNKALGIITASTIKGALYNDLSFESVKQDSIEIAKYLLKNDKDTQKEVGKVVRCKLEEYL